MSDPDLRSGTHVHGTWRPPSRDAVHEVVNPADGRVLATFAPSTAADCVEAVDAAQQGLQEWRATAPRDRAEVLRRAWQLMVDERDAIATTIVRENGKVLRDALAEVDYAAEFFRWFAEEAVRVHGDMRTAPSGDKWIMVTREPAGVAVLITPWNYPAAMAARKLAPALAAGCAVVLKPAVETPLTAFDLVDLLQRAGVPDGVVNLVTPTPAGPPVRRMLEDPRVRVLSFTGSTAVGRTLLASAAPNVVRCSMELGGNAPFLVLEDADLDAAVEGLLVAKLRNGGSACTAANRVLVVDALHDDFVEAFTERMRRVRVGDGMDPASELGALVNRETRDKVRDLEVGARRRGAVATASPVPDLPGWFHPATVLTDVGPDDPILREEIFGPVAPVVRVTDTDEAIRVANDDVHGLVAYAYSRDVGRALDVSQRLRAGMVGLNRGLVSDPAAPFGGVKHSGLGREGAELGIEEFLDVKYTALSRN